MKILLQINVVVNSGSTGRIAEEIGQMAIENGWQSCIAYGRNERPSKSKLIKIGTDLDAKLHGLKTRILDLHGFGSKTATKKLVQQIKEINPSVIHLHNLHGYFVNIEILFNYLSQANIPVVWTLHDCWSFTGHCTHFEYVGCKKWKTQCFSCPQMREYPKSIFRDNSEMNYLQKKKLFNSVENLTIIPVSDWLKNLVQMSFLSSLIGPVIKNGINIEIFNLKRTEKLREELGIKDMFVIIGVANVWTQRKGINDFIQLSKTITNDCRIVLIGLRKDQLLKIPSNIIGLAKTENVEQLAEYYSMADLFLNPTYEDNFPTTNLEALACGTPILTYNTGGSVEAVSPETGFVVDQGDIVAIHKVIEIVKERKKSSFSKACRERAINFFNKENSYKKYFELYEKILQ